MGFYLSPWTSFINDTVTTVTVPGRRPWVAEILGVDRKFGLNRRFLKSTVGPEDNVIWKLTRSGLYEWKDFEGVARGFFGHWIAGTWRLTADEAYEMLRLPSSDAFSLASLQES